MEGGFIETVQDSAAARAEQYDLYLIELKVQHERMARQENAVGVAVCLAVFAAELFGINTLWPWVTLCATSNPVSNFAFLVITLGITFGVWALVWGEFVTPLIRGHYSSNCATSTATSNARIGREGGGGIRLFFVTLFRSHPPCCQYIHKLD